LKESIKKKEGKQVISRNEQELKDDFKRLKRAVEKMEEDRNAFVARLSIDDMGSDYKKE
jgi:ribosomal protein S17E